VSERDGGDPAHRAIAAEHRLLSSLFAEARTALEKEDGGQMARAALGHLRDRMEAHFQREESLYYPTIWALRPDYMSPLRLLVDSHAHLRHLLEAITECVERAAHEDAARRFEEFTRLFQEHEGAEEDLLETLEQELIERKLR